MEEMKGTPRVALAYFVREEVISLLSYSDGSWGIRRGRGRAIKWESSERQECYRAFCRMCHLGDPLGLPMLEALMSKGSWIGRLGVAANLN